MEVVKPVDHSGIQTPDRLFEGVHLHNITRYSSQDHRISEKLSLTSMNGNDRLMDKDGKPEEIDTLPYTAGVLSIFIALFFLFGLIGAAIKEARDRKRDERKGMVAPLLVRSLQTFVRPAGFDVDKLGRNMFDGTFCEMFRIDISGLSETRLTGFGTLNSETYHILYSGLETRKEAGVGMALSSRAKKCLVDWEPINERILCSRFATSQAKLRVIVVYAPTNDTVDQTKDDFYRVLSNVVAKAHRHDIVTLCGDFNAKVGSDASYAPAILGKHGLGEINDNGVRLIDFCATHEHIVGASWFPHKHIHKYTWNSPDGWCGCCPGLVGSKSGGLDGVTANHIIHGGPSLICLLTLLFNGFFNHGYVPDSLTEVCLVSILNSNAGDMASLSNYRPIALATAISKPFEKCLYSLISPHIDSSHYQFGFKEGSSSKLYVFILKSIVQFFWLFSSPLFACFVDAKAAFDRVNHQKLLGKIDTKGVDCRIIGTLQYWFEVQRFKIKWSGYFSESFPVSNGVRQGGVL
ncbi:hypothetical protein QYM36_000642 [Artemia franciscana]|uniref:Reverse transcriptase domain-containing protein n=1 Tax=Artemia franciscana TaxID=6661 RepID=A0AA88LCF4_ARTSF|nr:hypothetical protein QYM36_000642 [Artemia franciscana]